MGACLGLRSPNKLAKIKASASSVLARSNQTTGDQQPREVRRAKEKIRIRIRTNRKKRSMTRRKGGLPTIPGLMRTTMTTVPGEMAASIPMKAITTVEAEIQEHGELAVMQVVGTAVTQVATQ